MVSNRYSLQYRSCTDPRGFIEILLRKIERRVLTAIHARKRAVSNDEGVELNETLYLQVHFRYFRFYTVIVRIVLDGTVLHYSEIE